MDKLVIRALQLVVLVQLLAALVAEGVATGQGERLLLVVVVWLEANTTLKNLIHLLSFDSLLFK